MLSANVEARILNGIKRNNSISVHRTELEDATLAELFFFADENELLFERAEFNDYIVFRPAPKPALLQDRSDRRHGTAHRRVLAF